MGVIDQASEPGKQLQAVVKQELKSYLGQDYNDECLPLYIVVMLAQSTGQTAVAENLVAFLGDAKAVQFADWLFEHLAEHPGKYEVAEKVVEADPASAADKHSGERAERGHKRRREKREKIEWKEEEHGRSSKHRDRDAETPRDRDAREEKRRRGRDGEARPERERNWPEGGPGGEPGTDRDKELRRLRRREALGGGEEQLRSRREERVGRHREGERHRRTRSDDPLEREEPKRESRRGQDRPSGSQANPDKPVQQGSRLAGRIGLPGAIQRPNQAGLPPPPREGARDSVFSRLNRKGEGSSPSDRTRMRMDAVPADRIDDVTVDFTPVPNSASKGQGSPQDMLEELRIIRESLAKLQANKEVSAAPTPALPAATAMGGVGLRVPVDHTSALAAVNARKVVVHNVHFNATPDILKAHFGGCGMIASAIIEKDFQGNSKGQAVIEFGDEAARRKALALSGSLLVGRPITVYAKETAPRSNPNPLGGFRPPMPAYPAAKFPPTTFRPRAPAPGRGAGRARPFLKSNKYVRPTAPPETATPANGGS